MGWGRAWSSGKAALAFHQCDPGSTPKTSAIYVRVQFVGFPFRQRKTIFSPGYSSIPSHQKSTFRSELIGF